MYATTNLKCMQAEVETSQRIVDKYDGRADLSEGQRDALDLARRTIRMYAPMLREHEAGS